MAEYSVNQLKKLSEEVFRTSPHEKVVYAASNGTFLNQDQYDKLKRQVDNEEDDKKKTSGKKHVDSITKIDNPFMTSEQAEAVDAKKAEKDSAAAAKVKELKEKEAKRQADADAKAKAKEEKAKSDADAKAKAAEKAAADKAKK
jgi:colicin import membrane protein